MEKHTLKLPTQSIIPNKISFLPEEKIHSKMSKKLKNFPIPGQAYKLCLIKNVLHTVIEDDNHHNEKNHKGRKASCKGTKKIQSKNNDIGVKMIRSNCSFSIVTPVIMAFNQTD